MQRINRNRRISDTEGHADAFLNCGGTGYPPYCLKYRGRWYVTEWVRVGFAQQGLCPQERDDVMGWVRSQPVLRYGTRRFQDYLERTGKTWRDVPRVANLLARYRETGR